MGLPWWFLCQISGYLVLRPPLEPSRAAGRVLSEEEQLRSPSQVKPQARIGAVGPVSMHGEGLYHRALSQGFIFCRILPFQRVGQQAAVAEPGKRPGHVLTLASWQRAQPQGKHTPGSRGLGAVGSRREVRVRPEPAQTPELLQKARRVGMCPFLGTILCSDPA